ncbi:AraC family transcriptional regulator [Rhodopseudomonas boonkerdii]|uniref:AraC family transcriptional regulator n=1 Tax=Rhodopseudomonas boonkerdii TaxID=475937 RepID=UPI001E4171A6|nr:AraC family transcriptional regulator [Rhodopseudomonas boonkerdii]UGV25896.1 AraC family transcriptional regulator [Rhodopseudomonas boonkerdii]
MQQASFVSDDFDPRLDDREKFAHWCDNMEALTCCVDITRNEDRPFSAFVHWSDFGSLQVSRFGGPFSRIRRSKTAISRGPDDDFCLLFHHGSGTFSIDHVGREMVLPSERAFLGTNGLPADMRSDAGFRSSTLTVSRSRLLPLVGHADELLAKSLDESSPAVAHLRRTIDIAVDLQRGAHDAQLDAHIVTTLLDLTALALGARGDAAEQASMRGLRASRTQEIIAEIDRRFADPGFSIGQVARRLGLSPRYLQDLLQETGLSFTDRLLERRLQHAMQLLTSEAGDRMKIGEIALACGFNEISYFNQRYRRRFGETPKQSRRWPVS